ncbi:hypothetical protein KY290_007094 [Solanum tuberosum]|uniref:Helicase C-terminal domain-containing protein n=1 Tax=Solanum tuberosum TaxID=4113 RepID=A0ABQ7W4P4_SOLTU|nr:hypothetical protein KY290_007094 [Solanum tuberosum]
MSMVRVNDVVCGNQQLSVDPLPFARRSYAYRLRKLSPYIAVFLVPTVVPVSQQGDALMMHTNLKVRTYWGEIGVDLWDAATWKHQVDGHEVVAMTPAILLSALRHNFLQIDMIKVIMFDECHNARGKHPYASIMMVYTYSSEAVLAEYIPFSNPNLKIYKRVDIPSTLSKSLAHDMESMNVRFQNQMSYKSAGYAKRRLSKLYSAFLFCLSEMGVWLAFKAVEFLSQEETDFFSWGELDLAIPILYMFSISLCYLSLSLTHSLFAANIGPHWSIGGDILANTDIGYLSSKVHCLLESLLEDLKDLRCIIFVERIITAIVLRSLLNELLPELSGWRTEYTAGHASVVQSQSRKIQNKIVKEFRKGVENIIVATSILEEGLDVQSCNLVIRFDPSATVCNYIQSRGRARILIISHFDSNRSGDDSTLTQMQNFMASGEMMRQESLRHASIQCSPLEDEMYDEPCYKVEST